MNSPKNRPDLLLSVARIRREYFDGPDAPTKREITSWIERGTVEGATLPGVVIGGRYFCRRRDVENFLSASNVEPRTEKRKTSAAERDTRAARVADALETLREFGIGASRRFPR
ncbi:MAG: hypothetical protein IJY15_08130 [Thermoguttaceae bacterium]|nr:hypothetical protein [Thermoguttaceae bacterium]